MCVIRGRYFFKTVLIVTPIIVLSLAFLQRNNNLILKDNEHFLKWFMNEYKFEVQVDENIKISVAHNNEDWAEGYDTKNKDEILPWTKALLKANKSSQVVLNSRKEIKNVADSFNLEYDRMKINSPWENYRNNWDGEKLVLFNDKVVIFSEKYRQQMSKKGDHSLYNYYPMFKERNKNVEKYCSLWESQYNKSNSLGMSGRRFLFVDKFELLACNIPKSSSTTITKIFMRMDQGLSNDAQPKGPVGINVNISISNNLDDETNMNAKRLQTFTKVILTRHPFSLIGSKYHFKVANTAEDKFQRETCPEIIKKLYLNGLPTDEKSFILNRNGKYAYLSDTEFNEKLFQIRRLKAGPGKYNVTLLEYIKTILNKQNDVLSSNGQTLICNPCAVRYDLILHYSNVYEEANIVLDYIQRDIPLEKRVRYPEFSPLVSQNKCNEEFYTIPMEIRKKLYEFFKLDFILFGYNFEDNLLSKEACY